MKKFEILACSIIFTLAFSMAACAGAWKQESDGRYWYQNDDGSYPVSGWQEIDGENYCFDSSGYMYADTTTPDMYQVGKNGARLADYQLAIKAPADFANLTETEQMEFFVNNEKAYGLKDSCALGKLSWNISSEGHTIIYTCNVIPTRELTDKEKLLLKLIVRLDPNTNWMGYETSKLYTKMAGYSVDFKAKWYVNDTLEYETDYAYTATTEFISQNLLK